MGWAVEVTALGFLKRGITWVPLRRSFRARDAEEALVLLGMWLRQEAPVGNVPKGSLVPDLVIQAALTFVRLDDDEFEAIKRRLLSRCQEDESPEAIIERAAKEADECGGT